MNGRDWMECSDHSKLTRGCEPLDLNPTARDRSPFESHARARDGPLTTRAHLSAPAGAWVRCCARPHLSVSVASAPPGEKSIDRFIKSEMSLFTHC